MIFSNWIARYCSWIFRSSFSPKVSLISAFKDIVFDELLGQGTSAAGTGVAGDDPDGRTDHRTDVNALVGPEPGILDRNEGVDRGTGKFLVGCLKTVRSGFYERFP